MISTCKECGHQHEHPDPEPPIRAKRWCIRDARWSEPYEGYQVWEAEMEHRPGLPFESKSRDWIIVPKERYRSRYDWSFDTREEAYAFVLKELEEELAEKRQEVADMRAKANADSAVS